MSLYVDKPASPRVLARTTGVFCVLEGLTSLFGGILVPGVLIVAGDAAATAANIPGNKSLFRLGIAANLLAVAFHVVQTVLFYLLFRLVSPRIAMLLATSSWCSPGSVAP